MGGRSSADKAELMGKQLAQMHRSLSPNGMYGFHVENTIGGVVSFYSSSGHAVFLRTIMAVICCR